MTDRKTEAASETRRGRPPVFEREWMAQLGRFNPEVKTERHRQNIAYAYDALARLKLLENPTAERDSRLDWLADWNASSAGKAGAVKWAVLTELGRLLHAEGPEAAHDIAVAICRAATIRDLSTKEAASIIRAARTGRRPAVDGETLGTALCKFLDDYRRLHPAVTYEQMAEALSFAHDAVQVLADEAATEECR